MTPEKKTKPRNLSPKRKTHKVEDYNEHSTQQEQVCKTLFF